VHLWGFDDMGDFERRHAARDKDPDWPAYLKASGHLITAQENRLIRRVDMPSLASTAQ
jgi:NIPSNAP